MVQVAIVGAGMAGVACARALADAGLSPLLVDRERLIGGRLGGLAGDGGRHDAGAQYFTAQDAGFQRLTDLWVQGGQAAPWQARTADPPPRPRFVGVPAMASIVEVQARGLPMSASTLVERLERHHGRWQLSDSQRSIGRFDAIVLAIPPADARQLLPSHPLLAELNHVRLDPCWSLAVTFERPLPLALDVIEPRDKRISFAARSGSKPGRSPVETWTIHASGGFSADHRLTPPQVTTMLMLDRLAMLIGTALPAVASSRTRFWPNSRVVRAAGEPCIGYTGTKLFLAGDWCIGPRVEAAWLSGRAAAAALLAAL